MDQELQDKIKTALTNGRCKHTKREEITDTDGNLARQICKSCGMFLHCSNCKYGQFNGYRNTFYCINLEENKFGSDTCREWKFHKSLRNV